MHLASLHRCPGLHIQVEASHLRSSFVLHHFNEKENQDREWSLSKSQVEICRNTATPPPPSWWGCGRGEKQEQEPHRLHPQELHQVDPDVLDDVGRLQDVPGQHEVSACFHSGTGRGSFGQVFALVGGQSSPTCQIYVSIAGVRTYICPYIFNMSLTNSICFGSLRLITFLYQHAVYCSVPFNAFTKPISLPHFVLV